jgi:hypothetical protein
MDPNFHPAIVAVKSGDLEAFRALLRDDPSLATDRRAESIQGFFDAGGSLRPQGRQARLLVRDRFSLKQDLYQPTTRWKH